MVDPVYVFIGYDKREACAYHTCVQSIIENCETPGRLRFAPVTGERRDGSNDFIYERFLIPWKCNFHGTAVFLDGDMIVKGDIIRLVDGSRVDMGVHVVKHPEYQTKYPIKYLGNRNEDYPRKNWSSVIVWNCGFWPHRILTPKYVRECPGEFLHRFRWLPDEKIGNLPAEWNRLVLEQDVKEGDKLLHYTIGIPAFPEYSDCVAASEWWDTFGRAIAPVERVNGNNQVL